MAKNEVDDAMFLRTLEKYKKWSGKNLPEICNTKSYWIARNTMQFTRKADAAEIDKFAKYWPRSGRTIIKIYKLNPGPGDLTKKGKWKQSYKRKYMNKLSKYRKRSIGYLRSGWVETLKKTGGWAKQRKSFKGVRQKGLKKGFCKPAAKNHWTIDCTFGSTVGWKPRQAEATKKYAQPAFRKAFKKEAIGMARYIIRKMAEAKRKSGIK